MEDQEGNLTVPYVVDQSLNAFIRRIEDAMQEIEACSRVKFVPMDSDDGQSLLVTSGNGCYFSPYDCIGNRSNRRCRPTVSIGEGCRSRGTMLHELMHAIGFEHEHQRPDRDLYVQIYQNNIAIDDRDQFEILSEDRYGWNVNEFSFDYASIMLYGEDDFSQNGRKTMKATDGRPLNGNKTQLSSMDKDKLGSL